jgi:putative tryptophan/tyrosine transport system substrate-binding protein
MSWLEPIGSSDERAIENQNRKSKILVIPPNVLARADRFDQVNAKTMNSKVVWLLTVFLLASVHIAEAQQPTKIPRIGWLTNTPLSANADRREAFRQGLHELGYADGKNISIEWRSTEGKADRAASLAAELVRQKVDIIVTAGSGGTRAAKKATSTIPIVMASDDNPVGNGFIVSLARPGGNITGLSQLSPELSGKRLEILKEVVPKLSRLAVMRTSMTQIYGQLTKEVDSAAGALGVKLQYLDVLTAKDIEPAFFAASKEKADAVLENITGSLRSAQRKEIAVHAVKYRLPLMRERPEHVETGGLMSYGIKLMDLDRRAATYVDKLLKGAKPADLPVEQPTKFELVINLKAAKRSVSRFRRMCWRGQIG